MILDSKEIQWIKSNQIIISEILTKLIEDKTNQMIEEEDDEKREKLRFWVKDLKLGLMILEQTKRDEKDKLSGI